MGAGRSRTCASYPGTLARTTAARTSAKATTSFQRGGGRVKATRAPQRRGMACSARRAVSLRFVPETLQRLPVPIQVVEGWLLRSAFAPRTPYSRAGCPQQVVSHYRFEDVEAPRRRRFLLLGGPLEALHRYQPRGTLLLRAPLA